MKIHIFYVCILTTKYNKMLYVGVTNNIVRRLKEHNSGLNDDSFTHKFNINKLVYFEIFDYIDKAIAREKQIKAYSRIKKENLINANNPLWQELDPHISPFS
ncbi:GIY-YIG nuclease family protein [bacterium]|nr:GIY-YIG nuclease family protein [bacterium]